MSGRAEYKSKWAEEKLGMWGKLQIDGDKEITDQCHFTGKLREAANHLCDSND